jgi:hypothetical protein
VHSDDDEKDIKNCYVYESLGILDCIEISEDSPEKISGGKRNVGYDALCDPKLDMAKVPPLMVESQRGGDALPMTTKGW